MTSVDKRPLKVFLCHAHADRDPVRGLYTRLTKDGVDAWFDKAKLLPGQDWELEIRKAVREADVVVVCLSKQFNQAGFRQKEVRLALDTAMEKPEGEIFIIPARLEECETLESLRRWHWVDLFGEGGYEKLILSLNLRAKKINASSAEIKSEQVKEKKIPKNFLRGLLDVKYLSVLIALIVLIFGNNIYEQVTGHSVFVGTFAPTATISMTLMPPRTSTPTVLPATISPTLTTATPSGTVSNSAPNGMSIILNFSTPMIFILNILFSLWMALISSKQRRGMNVQPILAVLVGLSMCPFTAVLIQFSSITFSMFAVTLINIITALVIGLLVGIFYIWAAQKTLKGSVLQSLFILGSVGISTVCIYFYFFQPKKYNIQVYHFLKQLPSNLF